MWMVGFEPTTQETLGLSTTTVVKELVGVLVRLTTCERSTNSLPKLSLITPLRCRLGTRRSLPCYGVVEGYPSTLCLLLW